MRKISETLIVISLVLDSELPNRSTCELKAGCYSSIAFRKFAESKFSLCLVEFLQPNQGSLNLHPG